MPESTSTQPPSPPHRGLFNNLLASDRPCRTSFADPTTDGDEEILLIRRPVMARAHPFLFLAACILIMALGLGLLILAGWAIRNRFVVLTVTPERTSLRRGVFTKTVEEVPNGALHNVEVYQSLVDRMLNVGTLRLSTAGQEAYEIQLSALPDPYTVKELIDQISKEGRWGRIGMTEHGVG